MSVICALHTVAVSPTRLASVKRLADGVSIQMASGGTSKGYVLYVPSGGTPSVADPTQVVCELAAASSDSPGGSFQIDKLVDLSLYAVGGDHAGDTIRVSFTEYV